MSARCRDSSLKFKVGQLCTAFIDPSLDTLSSSAPNSSGTSGRASQSTGVRNTKHWLGSTPRAPSGMLCCNHADSKWWKLVLIDDTAALKRRRSSRPSLTAPFFISIDLCPNCALQTFSP
ncbi:hypothetical protein MAR_028000 [Mya arenaria]|uniref:Uncharacterized protein n=1 Tax=Mya arenaria TaxID=6604 RepID=A0ABY7DF19_MYAAR|nr:hypothetical protein MAR_028000 [Mya arenaria]